MEELKNRGVKKRGIVRRFQIRWKLKKIRKIGKTDKSTYPRINIYTVFFLIPTFRLFNRYAPTPTWVTKKFMHQAKIFKVLASTQSTVRVWRLGVNVSTKTSLCHGKMCCLNERIICFLNQYRNRACLQIRKQFSLLVHRCQYWERPTVHRTVVVNYLSNYKYFIFS